MHTQMEALSAGIFVKGDRICINGKNFEVLWATATTLCVRRVGRLRWLGQWCKRTWERLERWLIRNWVIWE